MSCCFLEVTMDASNAMDMIAIAVQGGAIDEDE